MWTCMADVGLFGQLGCRVSKLHFCCSEGGSAALEGGCGKKTMETATGYRIRSHHVQSPIAVCD